VTIRLVDSFEQANEKDFVRLDNEIMRLEESKEWIECMRYSPSLTKLAVGSHDNWIYVYNVSAK
jgi:WD40 repeat protein